MKKILRSAFIGAAVGAIGLTACDAAPPPNVSVSPPVESEASPAGETLTDVVRDALADVVRDADAYSRARRLGTLLPTLSPESVPAVKQTLEDLTLVLGATELELLLRSWATHQPEEASRWALENSNPAFRLAALSTALAVWAEADPQGATSVAWEWGTQLPEISAAVHRSLVRGWFAANDLAGLRQFIYDIGHGFPQQRALATYARALIQTQGAEAGFRWADSLPDEEKDFKLAVHRQVVGMVQRYDHGAAVRWCDAHCGGPYGKNIRRIITQRWLLTDGAAAFAWLSTAPEGFERDVALKTSLPMWARRDREAAMGWMAAQVAKEPSGELDPWLRPAAAPYALLLAEDAPADAIAWAERVEHDGDREWVLVQAVRAWRQVDEAAAEAWLLESSLSEEARDKARAPAPRRRILMKRPPND